MAQKSIVVLIDPDGKVNIEALNFQGQGCAAATRELEVALNGSPADADRKKKPDFFVMNGQPISSGGR